jgi:hypothetical protein
MASLFTRIRKTIGKAFSRSKNVVRRVGKGARSTLKRVTNAVGLTTKAHRKGRKSGRKSGRRSSSKRNSQRN